MCIRDRKSPELPVPVPPETTSISHNNVVCDPSIIGLPSFISVVAPMYPVILPTPILAYPPPPLDVDPLVFPPGFTAAPPCPTVT